MLENTTKTNPGKANASTNKASKRNATVTAATAVIVQTCMLGSDYVRCQVPTRSLEPEHLICSRSRICKPADEACDHLLDAVGGKPWEGRCTET